MWNIRILILALFLSSFARGQFIINSYAYAQSDPYLTGDGTGGAPVAYFNANEIAQSDGTDVLQWDDLTGNGYHLQDALDAPVFDNSSGYNQVVFDGVDDALKMFSNHAALDFDPDSSEYTIIIHMGNVTLDNFTAYTLHKGTATSPQFWLRTNSSGDNMDTRAGNVGANLNNGRTTLQDDFVVIRRVAASNTITYLNNTQEATLAPGSTVSTHANGWSIGGRADNNTGFQTGSYRKVIFYDYAADLTWLTTRYNNRTTE